MNPTAQISRAETVLQAILDRFAANVAASGTPAIGTPLAGLSAGPEADLGRVQSRKLPWLTVTLTETARRQTTADGQIENRALLDLTLYDAAHGGKAGTLLAHRWAAWIESILIPAGERNSEPPLNGLADALEPQETSIDSGGLGFSALTVRTRFRLTYSTDLGTPFTA